MMPRLKGNEAYRNFYKTLSKVGHASTIILVGGVILAGTAFAIDLVLPDIITSFQLYNKKEITAKVPEGATISSLVKNELGIGNDGNIFQKLWNKGRRNALEDALWDANESGYRRSKTDELQAGAEITVIDYNGNGQADW